MKSIFKILIVGLAVFSTSINAQDSAVNLNDFDRIGIAPYISDQIEYFPLAARNSIENKLSAIISSSGYGNSVYNSRFILTPNIEVASKHITATAPPKVAMNLNIYFYIGDGFTGTKFESGMVSVKGVGNSEEKAYINAMKNIKTDNPEIKRMISNAKKRILNFYETQCDFILKDADVAASQHKYEESLYLLTSIPRVNKSCYDKAMAKVSSIYQKMIDNDCKKQLLAAKTEWDTGRDYASAVNAREYLIKIEPASSCYSEARILSVEIGKRMEEHGNNTWDYEMQKLELQGKRMDNYNELVLEYVRNQPQTIYQIRGWW
jgi:hypothetical protein